MLTAFYRVYYSCNGNQIVDNKRIAEILAEIGDILEVEGKRSRFEVLAYRKAAATIETLQERAEDIYQDKGLEGLMELQGIGKGIAGGIAELIDNGHMKKYDSLKRSFPVDFNSLTKIQGLGPKKVYRLYKELGIRDMEGLKKAVEKHKIRELEGFGEKSELEIGKGLELMERSGGRMLLGRALPEAEKIIERLRSSGIADKVELAGSARRMRESVGDLDILATSDNPAKITGLFSSLDEVERVLLTGPTKTTALLKIGITCDLRVVAPDSFGAAMQYFIGNKDHNVKVREIAIKKGYKLNEYGLFGRNGRIIAAKDERDVYEKLGMQYMPPEMRENRGEIELSLKGKIPAIIELNDIKGDLHTHTNHSDGTYGISEMAEAARKSGLEYIGITDHTKNERIANGMDDSRFARHFDEIDKVNEGLEGMRILKGAEIDILKDGSLDLKRKTLEMMDYRLATVHTNLKMSRDEMTDRIIKALSSGYVDIFGHPTDRLIGRREPINMDLERVFDAAQENGVIMEIDSFPDRLDLGDENIIKAKKHGLSFSIDSDSHSTDHFSVLRYGVGTARRGWLSRNDVVNALPLDKLVKLFKSF
jgi:DNA polymerase (family 10)